MLFFCCNYSEALGWQGSRYGYKIINNRYIKEFSAVIDPIALSEECSLLVWSDKNDQTRVPLLQGCFFRAVGFLLRGILPLLVPAVHQLRVRKLKTTRNCRFIYACLHHARHAWHSAAHVTTGRCRCNWFRDVVDCCFCRQQHAGD